MHAITLSRKSDIVLFMNQPYADLMDSDAHKCIVTLNGELVHAGIIAAAGEMGYVMVHVVLQPPSGYAESFIHIFWGRVEILYYEGPGYAYQHLGKGLESFDILAALLAEGDERVVGRNVTHLIARQHR